MAVPSSLPSWVLPLLALIVTAVLAPSAGATPPTQLCMTGQCHPGFANAEFIHGPIATGMCPLCHDKGEKPETLPEGHPDTRLSSNSETCLLCHEEIQALIGLGFVHTPVADGDCVDCHDPHQGDNSHFLLHPPAIVDGRRMVSATCQACHEPGDPSWYDDFHATEAILDCTICHNAHASKEKYQLTRYVRDVYVRSALLEGGELRDQGKFDAAVAAYRKALSVISGDIDTMLLLGEVYMTQQKWQQAYDTYADILDGEPQHVEALMGAGDAVAESDGPAAALAYYNRALDTDPGRADIHLRVGTIYRARGQAQESLASLGKAAELDPENPLVYQGLAETYKVMGNEAEAAKALEKYEALTK